MKNTIRVLSLLVAMLLLTGCGLLNTANGAPKQEAETQQSTSDGGIHIYGGDENIFFAGGKLDELMVIF